MRTAWSLKPDFYLEFLALPFTNNITFSDLRSIFLEGEGSPMWFSRSPRTPSVFSANQRSDSMQVLENMILWRPMVPNILEMLGGPRSASRNTWETPGSKSILVS